jgi:succinylglutamate desuccinylase
MNRPQDARFIDENLNRCCSIENLSKSTSYEVRRALELQPVLKDTDIHFDIHSTYTPSESILINTPESQ